MSTKKLHKVPAKITDAFLGFEDHGFFTVILHVDYGHVSQGVGLLALGFQGHDRSPMRATKSGCDFIMRVLKACGVRSWDRLKGCRIQVLFEEEFQLNSQPVGIEGFEFDGGEAFLFEDHEKRAKYESLVEKKLIKDGTLNESLWTPGWKHE